MEYFRKYFKEIVTIVVLLMGVYLLILATIVQSKFQIYNSSHFISLDRYEFVGKTALGQPVILNRQHGTTNHSFMVRD